jgi:hypothetical protein
MLWNLEKQQRSTMSVVPNARQRMENLALSNALASWHLFIPRKLFPGQLSYLSVYELA